MYNSQLETFICVADAGSFSKGAEILYISATAVIKQINRLEQDLGIVLFNRTPRGITLTDAGKSLYNDAKYIIQFSLDSIERAKLLDSEADSIIRVGSSPITPGDFMISIWPRISPLLKNTKFELIPFENTPENAREKLLNLGQYIDVVAGVFDEELLQSRKCKGLLLEYIPICVVLSMNHELANKSELTIEDLFGQNLMLIERGWNCYMDVLRDDIENSYPSINILDFPFYNVSIFNQCENNSALLIGFNHWDNVHPLLKVIRVKWSYNIPYGILYSTKPSKKVQMFIQSIAKLSE